MDREQTHESIRSELIEETYEVIEAIDQKDPAMPEELGDLFLQVVFHVQIEQEQAHFTLEDVCTGDLREMIVRHPHVFSTAGGYYRGCPETGIPLKRRPSIRPHGQKR